MIAITNPAQQTTPEPKFKGSSGLAVEDIITQFSWIQLVRKGDLDGYS